MGKYVEVSRQNPMAQGVCDRCGFNYNLYKLRWEVQYRGRALVRTGFRVCPACYDVPNPQLKARTFPPDPVPVRDPRPEMIPMDTPMTPMWDMGFWDGGGIWDGGEPGGMALWDVGAWDSGNNWDGAT